MPSVTYDEDLEEGVDLAEEDIAECGDRDVLLGWLSDIDAAIEDIKAQVEISALGGVAQAPWVYRCGKAMGYMRRAQSRIRTRLGALGWVAPKITRDLAEASRKLAETNARANVAIEFLRLSEEGGIRDRAVFHALEAQAIDSVRRRKIGKAA